MEDPCDDMPPLVDARLLDDTDGPLAGVIPDHLNLFVEFVRYDRPNPATLRDRFILVPFMGIWVNDDPE